MVPWQLGVKAMLSVWHLWVVREKGLAPLGHVIPSSGIPRHWLAKVLLFHSEYRGSPGNLPGSWLKLIPMPKYNCLNCFVVMLEVGLLLQGKRKISLKQKPSLNSQPITALY